MVDPAVEKSTRKYLRLVRNNGLLVRFGVVFGSQTTRRTDRLRNIEVLVVSPHFDGQPDRRDTDLLWHLAAEMDSRIEPVPCGELEWREDTSNDMVETARREGHIISPED